MLSWRGVDSLGDSGVFTRFAGKCHAAFLVGDDGMVDRLTEELQQEVCASARKLQTQMAEAQEVWRRHSTPIVPCVSRRARYFQP